MIFKIKYIVILAGIFIAGWLSRGTYTYFFDRSTPTIIVQGIEEGHFYAGDLTCQITSSKAGELSVKLDGQPLSSNYRLSSKQTNCPFTIPTKTITNGAHSLVIELTDTTFHKNKNAVTYNFIVDNMPLQASFVRSDADYKVFQGRTLHVQFQVNKPIKAAKINALATTYSCVMESQKSPIYECFVPIPCEEAPNEYLFSVEIADHVGNTVMLDNKFQIIAYPFKKQNLQVSAETVEKEKQVDLAMADLEARLQKLAMESPQEKLWRGSFCTPIDISKITCDFGTVRTTQERGRYMHKALDVINMPKSVVWATQDGIVAIKDRYAFSGNTVVIDHGCGVLSLFFHLDDFANITVGQRIKKGNPIGTLGKTGYATGYHLHWELRVNNVAVDPMQWTKTTF
ncbi:MAG: M23 family metallopeptidase [Candidatus Dependentiae bacterium]|nr:M23 family metallopeptidase [Candidatus Dependentiae bacterium]